jgi:NAD-dependent dihydropyrimidine dehydrogenase PreA subunit
MGDESQHIRRFFVYEVDQDKCTGCATCVDACPSGAINVTNEKAAINQDECVDCGACESECPNSSIVEA